jgi:hypothetical protein
MNYKIVRNAAGEIVCFGQNDNNYEPTIKDGETLTIEDAIPPLTPPTYKDLRAQAYPSIGDQLDAIWKGGDAQADMLKQVMAVKNKYPKG